MAQEATRVGVSFVGCWNPHSKGIGDVIYVCVCVCVCGAGTWQRKEEATSSWKACCMSTWNWINLMHYSVRFPHEKSRKLGSGDEVWLSIVGIGVLSVVLISSSGVWTNEVEWPNLSVCVQSGMLFTISLFYDVGVATWWSNWRRWGAGFWSNSVHLIG